MAGIDDGLDAAVSVALSFHRAEQGRHSSTARLQQAYGDRLLRPASAGPALVLALGSLVGEANLALHLVSARGLAVASGASLGLAASCRDLEDRFAEGPGVDAITSGAVVIETTGTDLRWPHFARAAFDLGVRSVIAVPLVLSGARVGAVTIYSDDPLHVAAATIRLVPVLSEVLLRLVLDDEEAGTTHALGPIAFPASVHQVTGMIAVRHGIGVEDALALLRARAFADDLALSELADLVVDGRADLD